MAGSGEKLLPGTLCVVCEDLATGNHYNVASCSGCKTFFRRAVVNNRTFNCTGNGNCPLNKDVRCACRYCRFKKCLEVGMDRNAIQNDRDRIGYTKRTRRKSKMKTVSPTDSPANGHDSSHDDKSDYEDVMFGENNGDSMDVDLVQMQKPTSYEPILERITQLENYFSLLLSRGKITPYASLDDALQAPSVFIQPITVKVTDPIATPAEGSNNQCKMPFWRSRIIALYIDWAKTFPCFRKLPYMDQVTLLTNHASSYMIMCEAFRTPEHKDEDELSSFDANMQFSPAAEAVSPDAPSSISTQASASASCISEDKPFSMGVHAFFDPALISTGFSCGHTGVRSLVDVPPGVHYPSVGSLSGLTPVMAIMIDYVMKPFRRLNITTTEFATLQAIAFFDPDTDGLDAASQRNVAIEQKKLIAALYQYISQRHEPAQASERYAAILLRIPTIRKVAAKKNESLQIIDMFNLFSLNSLVKETALGIRPQNQNSQPTFPM